MVSALGVSGLATGALSAPSSQRFNILYIVSEDNGPEIGCYGTPIKTPHLDALAGTGVRFTNAYVPQAGCSPSRASFLTGLYPHQNGQIGLATWDYSMYSQEIPNVVTTLKKAGYRTGIIGKLHVNPENSFPFDFKAIPDSNFGRRDMGAYTEDAAKFFTESDKPFYLQVNYPDAHWPFLKQADGRPQEPLEGKDVDALAYMGINHPELKQLTADYYNSIMRLDSHIGDLLDALEKSGKADSTVVIYIGDHGADLLRGKRTCYEGGVRIPMIIRWPDGARGQVRDELVSTIDLFPTFCRIAGVEAPDNLPGQSLEAIAKGENPVWRKYLFTEFHVHSHHNPWPQRTVRNDRYKLIHNPLAGTVNPGYDFSMTKRLTSGEAALLAKASPQVKKAYAVMKQPPEYELYDLKTDPFEFKNLADDPAYADQRNELAQQLREWQEKTGDALSNPDNARKLFDMIQRTNLNREKKLPYKEFMDMSLQ
jgi:N-sulfoglucosamine sulfohydrolase